MALAVVVVAATAVFRFLFFLRVSLKFVTHVLRARLARAENQTQRKKDRPVPQHYTTHPRDGPRGVCRWRWRCAMVVAEEQNSREKSCSTGLSFGVSRGETHALTHYN